MEIIRLTRLNNLDMLQRIQDRFSEVTGLAAVTVDYSGKPVTKYSNFSSFCAFMRATPEFQERCHRCDAFGGLEAARKKKPYIYKCHSGLTDFAIPIIVDEQYVGSLLVGQTRMSETEEVELDSISQHSTWEQYEQAKEAYEKIPVTSYKKIAAAADMMFLVVNHLLKQSMTEMMKVELEESQFQLLQETKEKERLLGELKRKDIQTEQLKMNPYFLFGMLNTASRLSIIEDAPRTGDVIFSLTEFLRYMLEHKNLRVTLQQELVHVENYIHMQSIRFGIPIDLQIQIPQTIRQIEIPAMLVQAIVDNSVTHGFQSKKEDERINIRGLIKEQDLVIEIEDNGIGMKEDQVEALKHCLAQEENKRYGQGRGLGIPAINQVLQSQFGKDYILSIQSNYREGTTVSIRVPLPVGSLSYA